MKFFSLITLGLLLLSSPVFAIDCSPNASQSALNQCADKAFRTADKALNQAYDALIKRAGKDKFAIKKLRESQRLWIKFRDAELDYIFPCKDHNKRHCWGSMIGILYPEAKKDLTIERTQRLKKYLKKQGHY
ncbi:MAG: DUF1311 domain-containing protein [Cocleimonas sp.]|nr:DUF1311 domain-containing protein [Cocleimonas sp.]